MLNSYSENRPYRTAVSSDENSEFGIDWSDSPQPLSIRPTLNAQSRIFTQPHSANVHSHRRHSPRSFLPRGISRFLLITADEIRVNLSPEFPCRIVGNIQQFDGMPTRTTGISRRISAVRCAAGDAKQRGQPK